MRIARLLLLALAALPAAACGDDHQTPAAADAAAQQPEADAAPPAATCVEETLEASLGAIPAVSSVSETPCGDYVAQPARCFAIQLEQPVDPAEPAGGSFPQHLFLTHRGCDRPTVVADWGYSQQLFFDDELSVLFQANALWVEHRFQGASLPAAGDWDWSALSIENGAGDLHRVIAAFRPFYQGRWVSTGASKGGITATYHRYFYPDDLDGTIPYVAPASRARVDSGYQDYLDSTMTGVCADRIRAIQVAALTDRRDMMIARLTPMTGAAAAPEWLEILTNSLDWGFWQAWGAAYCDQVPRATAGDARFWQFYLDFSYLSQFAATALADEERSLGALYWEWLTEQGFALQIGDHVAPLLQEPAARATMAQQFRRMFPDVALPPFDGSVTAAVRAWARDEADDLLLIYGQLDPWSGGALDEPVRETSARYFVPAASHAAQIGALPEEERAAALAHAARMFGSEPVAALAPAARRAAEVRDRLIGRQLLRGLSARLRRVR